ncbi:OmpA family protein [Mariprofundus ferrooxydans]|nr:OmpA family protein [Mariprofundus ferrooxydans]
MMHRIIIGLAALSMTACAHNINIDRSELDAARAAIAAAKAAGAEQCAPKLQAEAVASLYWAAHELNETDYHPDENAELIAQTEAKAKAAHKKALPGCAIEIIKLKGVYFDTDKANLKPASVTTLDHAVKTLKHRSDINVEVAAHTDSTGSDTHNNGLSNRRAASVKAYLESHGIAASRLSSKGYGETQPIASNATAAGRATNRRVELRVLAQ